MECALFCTASVDILQDINVKAHARARGKSSYKVSVLAAQCLATRNMAFITMPGFGTKEVAEAMDMFFFFKGFPRGGTEQWTCWP